MKKCRDVVGGQCSDKIATHLLLLQVIEVTVNRESKTRGGIRGITLNRGAVQRWILAQPERADITRQCELMSDSEKLVCLSSGAVASSEVQGDLLNALSCGEAAAIQYLKARLIENLEDMFASIKQKRLKTFGDNKRR